MNDNLVDNFLAIDQISWEENIYNVIDRKAVDSIIDNVLNVIYPGFFEKINKNIRLYLEEKVNLIRESLKIEIDNAYKIVGKNEDIDSKVNDFINKLADVKKILSTDIDAIFEGDPAARCKEEIILCYPGMYAITIYRLSHVLYELGIPIIPRIISERAHSKTGIDIHPGASIGKYFFIDHGTGIVIGETTIIGEHVKIYQGVTLGALSLKNAINLKGVKRHPTIKDYVTIYSGASIFGGNTIIGNNTTIGSNAFITESVEPYMLITLNFQKKKNKSEEKA